MHCLSKIFFVVFTIAISIYITYIFHSFQQADNATDASLVLEDFGDIEERPLKSTKYVDNLYFTSLKNLADDIRHQYNRIITVNEIVLTHTKNAYNNGFIDKSLMDKVEQITNIRKDNALKLKTHFKMIAAYAEKMYAEGFIQKYSDDSELNIHLFDENLKHVMQNVETPIILE